MGGLLRARAVMTRGPHSGEAVTVEHARSVADVVRAVAVGIDHRGGNNCGVWTSRRGRL
jgi:hypothetical protein